MQAVIAILAVIALGLALYLLMPAGVPGIGSDAQLADMPEEGNGLMGRAMDFMADLTWDPLRFLVVTLALGVGTAGLAVYWRGIED